MNKILQVYFYNVFLLVFFFTAADGQEKDYAWQAVIAPVTHSGFYQLHLSPNIIGLSMQPQVVDLRIYEGNQEVPYLIREKKLQATTSFDTLSILSYKQDNTKHSVLTIGNPKERQLNQLLVIMNNASTDKEIQLSGSYDQQKWYAVKEKFPLSATIVRSAGTEMVALLNFPNTSYTYYRLVVSDSLSAPLFIKKVGIDSVLAEQRNPYLDSLSFAKMEEVPHKQDLSSLWRVSYDQAYLIQQLTFRVSTPKLFRREVKILLKEQLKDAQGRKREDYMPVGSGVLTPNNLVVSLDGEIKTNEFFVEINNANNAPLSLQTVTAWQRQYDLITYLEEGTAYKLVLGNPKAAKPNYDLSYFENTIKEDIPLLKLEEFHPLNQQGTAESPRVFKTVYWLWAGLALVLALLLWMSNNLLREMKKKK